MDVPDGTVPGVVGDGAVVGDGGGFAGGALP